MTIYTVANTAKAGKPCKVFDAIGNEVVKCTMADDETGLVERFAVDASGKLICHRGFNELAVVRELRPLPFRFEAIQKDMRIV